MKLHKIVSATVAAEAMGRFSSPDFGSVAEELVSAIKAGTAPSSPEGDEALECFAALERAKESGKPLFWCATHSVGGRHIESSHDPMFVPDWGLDGGWEGYHPNTVIWALYISATSGATLEWRPTSSPEDDGTVIGVLSYEHADGYQGAYYAAWESAPALDMVLA